MVARPVGVSVRTGGQAMLTRPTRGGRPDRDHGRVADEGDLGSDSDGGRRPVTHRIAQRVGARDQRPADGAGEDEDVLPATAPAIARPSSEPKAMLLPM